MEDTLFNIRLVKLIEKYPILYNSNLNDYNRKNLTDVVWAKIAMELSKSVDFIKAKWKNLRSVYNRRLKEKSNRKSNRAYYLANEMRFLLPFLSSKSPGILLNNIKDEIQNKDDTNDSTDALANIPDTFDGNEVIVEEILQESPDTENYDSAEYSEKSFSDTPPEPKRRRKYETPKKEDEFMNNLVMKRNIKYDEESKKHFLLSLLYDVKQMNDSQMRKFKLEVMKLVDEILTEEENDHSDNKRHVK